MSRFTINLFGPLKVTAPDGSPVAVPGAKQQALLAFLAYNVEQGASRNRLINLLWGDRFDEQARQSLRQAISKLRKILNTEGEILLANEDRLGLDAGQISVDTHEFELLAKSQNTDDILRAANLYTDTLLEGLPVNDAAYEEWLALERGRMNDLACKVFSRAADWHVEKGDPEAAIATTQKLLLLDPLREPSHRQLMRILAQSGQRAAALKQYQTCRDLLKAELDVEPDEETAKLYGEIRAIGTAPLPDESDGAEGNKSEAPASPFFGAPSASSQPTLAVLGVNPLGTDPETQVTAEAMTDDMTTALARYRWLSLVATTDEADGQSALAQQRAAEQGAEYALESTLRLGAGRIRLTVHLIDLRSRKYLWVERYDRTFDDLFAVQDELVETIAATLESELTHIEGNRARHIDNKNMSAWDCYHLGLAVQYEFGKDSNRDAQELFRRAITKDPNFGIAYARLSYALVISTIYFEADETSGILEEAIELARKATRLDDQDAIAHFALGRAHLALGEYDESLISLETAIRLNPTMAQAHCGLGDSLAYAGRLEESVSRFEEAIRLSPNDPYRWAFLMYGAVARLFMKDFETAADWGAQAMRVPNSHYWANAVHLAALGHLGRGDEIGPAREELLRLNPHFTCSFARTRLFYLRSEHQIALYVDGLSKAGIPD